MDAIIFRKPSTVFNLSFNDVVDKIQWGRNPRDSDEATYPTLSYVCENFPKNSFMRVDSNGIFHLYHIRGDAEVIYGSKCITTLRMLEANWCATQNLDDVFCALDFDSGNSIELSEVRRRVSDEQGNKTYNKPKRRNHFRNRNRRSHSKAYYTTPVNAPDKPQKVTDPE